MKILILGHAQHGKDTLAEILHRLYGITFVSSSRAALEAAVWPALRAAGIYYTSFDEAYADRDNHRPLWKQAITDYNTPDKSRLCREILSQNDLYVGMRCDEEYAASKHLFGLILWVERPFQPADKTMMIKFNPLEMETIINLGSLANMERQVQKVMKTFSEK